MDWNLNGLGQRSQVLATCSQELGRVSGDSRGGGGGVGGWVGGLV